MGNGLENKETMNWPNETLIEACVRYILDLDGNLFVFENIPVRINPSTGEQLFSRDTVRRIQQIALSASLPDQTIQVGL